MLAATFSGGPVVTLVFFLARAGKKATTPAAAARDELPWMAWIGALERFGFTLALILGLPTVAAILLGVKALGQYTSVDNQAPALRVLGTLTSVSWDLVSFAVIAFGYSSVFGALD